jgi:hypothetical protein
MIQPKRFKRPPVLQPAKPPEPRKPGKRYTGAEFAERLPLLNRSGVVDLKPARKVKP